MGGAGSVRPIPASHASISATSAQTRKKESAVAIHGVTAVELDVELRLLGLRRVA